MKRRPHCLSRLPTARWAGALLLGHNLLAGQPHTPLNAAGSVSELDSAPAAKLRDTPTLRGAGTPALIDRHALVTRHNLEWNDPRGQVPLGNGEFCFNADATGLQTFGGSTLSHWAWHSAPLPPGFTPADIPSTGTVETGRIQGPMKTAAARGELDGWMFRNPHPINLARLRFVRTNGTVLKADDITAVSRRYDLWSGLHASRFTVDGEQVVVETCVHPVLDLVAVRAVSPLLRDGQLVVALDFPYPTANNSSPWVGDWNRHHAHTSELTLHANARRADIRRTADTATYQVSVGWGEGGVLGKWSDEAARKELTISSPSCHPASKASPGTRCSISLTGAGVSIRRSAGASGWALPTNRAGTRSAATSHPCRWWKACSSIPRNGMTPTRSVPGNTPIRSASWACCHPWRG